MTDDGRQALGAAVAAVGGIADDVAPSDARATAIANVAAAFATNPRDAERWEAVGFLARGDAPDYNSLPEPLRDAHRALIRLAVLVDVADGEQDPDNADGGLTYRTSFRLDEQYRLLGEALDAFRESVR